MSRQSELFAGQDWQVIYEALTQINFNASDPATINRALREYIQVNYAEDFSDWIASSEFIAILDLIAYIAGTLAFKTDINARENFLESAEARESVLRLARFLSYSPRRNQAARGLLKITAVQTSDDVFDAFGNNLSNLTISWNDADDPDWFDRFVLVLNNAMTPSNPFGVPLKTASLSGVRTQLYRFETRFGDASLGFSRSVTGITMPFEVINTDFDADFGFYERAPDLYNALHLAYRNDGNGNSSAKTGFFMAFKQGTLLRRAFQIDDATENLLLDIDVDNINETDVWVQTVDTTGRIRTSWDKVPAIFADNITYNTLAPERRNIFSVITRADDRISLRFSDGRFGNVPTGTLRTWYRTSNGLQYQIRPQDIDGVTLRIPFVNRRGIPQTLTLTLSLTETVSNATQRETDEQIKQRAPSVYATQNRMVSGEDYNVFPLQSNLAKKIKAITRVYSGHSRHIDLHDPTGNYQDLSVFSDDGIFYQEPTNHYVEVVAGTNSADEIITNHLQPMLSSRETMDYMLERFNEERREGNIEAPESMFWNRVRDQKYISTGSLTTSSPLLAPGAQLLIETNGERQWVAIQSIDGEPTAAPVIDVFEGFEKGPVTLAQAIPDTSAIIDIIPAYRHSLSGLLGDLRAMFNQNLSFSLWYDYAPEDATFWRIQAPERLTREPRINGSTIKVASVEYLSGSIWRMSVFGLRYVFESLQNVRFYFEGKRAVDGSARTQNEDYVRVLKVNTDLATTRPLGQHYDLAIDTMITQMGGVEDAKRVSVSFRDTDEDGYADEPETFSRLVSGDHRTRHLFWRRNLDGTYVPFSAVVVFEREAERVSSAGFAIGTIAYQIEGHEPHSFWINTQSGWQRAKLRDYRHAIGRGPNGPAMWVSSGGTIETLSANEPIMFQWKHFAPNDRRIDPSRTNIIDIFVLTSEYDYLVRQWIATSGDIAELPPPPTELDLRNALSTFESFKMFTDEIIWRPVRYKFLFGPGAAPELRAQFKVIKLASATLSDGEIKTRILRAINDFFNTDLWNFGETFYYTELAAYLHQQLAGTIASVVIVPLSSESSFGDGFEIRSRPDEMFISTAQVSDIVIIDTNTPHNLRIC